MIRMQIHIFVLLDDKDKTMKNTINMKKKSLMIVIAALTMSMTTLRAQQGVWEFPNMVSTGSIVRDAGSFGILVYNDDGFFHTFSLMQEGEDSANTIFVTMDTVCDVYIFKGCAFFCGSRTDANGSHAAVGWFSLSGFPNVTVYYGDDTTYSVYKKMEVYLHVQKAQLMTPSTRAIMIALDKNGHTQLPVVIWNSYTSSSILVQHYTNTINQVFCDIAQTDNYFIFTAHNSGWIVAYYYIWLIPKPVGLSMYTFEYSFSYFRTPFPSGTDIKVEPCSGDYYAVVASTYNSGMSVAYMNWSYVFNFDRWYLWNYLRVLDIKYNPSGACFSVLSSDLANLSPGSQRIYNSVFTSLFSADTVYGFNPYTAMRSYSIDKISSETGGFVASSSNKVTKKLRLFKYTYNHQGSCLTNSSVKQEELHYDPITPTESGFDCSFSTIPVQVASPNKKKYQIITICSSNKNTKQ